MAVPDVWQGRLVRARTPDDVVIVCREFIGGCSTASLTNLPKDFSSEMLRTAEDVSAYAFTLMQQHLTTDTGAVELQDMAEFFVAASRRLTQLLAEH